MQEQQQDNSGKTHYRKAFNSPYLSSADIVGPTVLTIHRVELKIDQSKQTKDMFNTVYFQENEIRAGEILKPMILNAGNSVILRNLAGSHFIEDWAGMKITVYVQQGVKFGRDTVEGLRVSPEAPVIELPELTPANKTKWSQAIAAFKRDGNLQKVLTRMQISSSNQKLIQAAAKEEVPSDA
jgi:hypothetical protein